jgi:hypothetical protein
VSLIPKAGLWKVSHRGKQKRSSIFEDTPEKRATVEEKKNKKATVQKGTAIKTKKKIKRQGTKKTSWNFLKARQTKAMATLGVYFALNGKTSEDWVAV